jgi:hypothetical protein
MYIETAGVYRLFSKGGKVEQHVARGVRRKVTTRLSRQVTRRALCMECDQSAWRTQTLQYVTGTKIAGSGRVVAATGAVAGRHREDFSHWVHRWLAHSLAHSPAAGAPNPTTPALLAAELARRLVVGNIGEVARQRALCRRSI